jgi:DNA-binding CsgD family transcriptional regulator
MSAGAAPAPGGGHQYAGLLGRDRELSALTSMLDAALAGRGSALLLRGEAGIGETSLLAQAERLAEQRGLQVLRCSGVRAETHLAFAGLHQLLRPVLSVVPSIECAPLIADLTADLRDHPTPAVRFEVRYADAILAADDAAEAGFQAALAADPGGARLGAGRLHLAYGSWLRRHRRMREARAELARAHDTFTSLGTGGFAYRASRELHAAGGARQLPHRDGLPQLTPQELQIARPAASGLSNRQIGEQLFLSHRTVGSHLYHLFPKLGISTRAQLANALKTAGMGNAPG